MLIASSLTSRAIAGATWVYNHDTVLSPVFERLSVLSRSFVS